MRPDEREIREVHKVGQSLESCGRRRSRLKTGTRSLPNGPFMFEPPGLILLADFQPASWIATGFPVGGWEHLNPDFSAGLQPASPAAEEGDQMPSQAALGGRVWTNGKPRLKVDRCW